MSKKTVHTPAVIAVTSGKHLGFFVALPERKFLSSQATPTGRMGGFRGHGPGVVVVGLLYDTGARRRMTP